jgi:hypothetical protein
MKSGAENLKYLRYYGVKMLAYCTSCNRRRAFAPDELEPYSNVGDMDSVASMARRMLSEECQTRSIVGFAQPVGFPIGLFLQAWPGDMRNAYECAPYCIAPSEPIERAP